MARPSLGLIMILKDERENLERSLAPVAACFDQVVAVDTGSSDQSARFCRQLGAQVHHFPWVDDFSAARNFSIQKAGADWLFWLDGDNAITPEDVEALRESLPPGGPAVIWARERVIPSGETLWQKRLFPRRPEVRFQGRVHEQLIHPAHWPGLAAQVEVLHWGYEDPAKVRQKGEYYLTLLNQTLEDSPGDFYAHFQAARCLLNLRRSGEAQAHLEALLASGQARMKNPELWLHGHFMLARILEAAGRGDRARELINRLLQSHGDKALVRFQAGRQAHADGRWAEAVVHLERALALGLDRPLIDLNPEKTVYSASYMLGSALHKLGREQKALAALALAAQAQPDNPAPLVEAARWLLAAGRRQEAQARLRRALAVRPGDRAAARLLARCSREAA